MAKTVEVNVIYNNILSKVTSIYMKEEDAKASVVEDINDWYETDPSFIEKDGKTEVMIYGDEIIFTIYKSPIIKEISERSGFGILLEL